MKPTYECAICWEDEKLSCMRMDHAEATRKRREQRGRPWSRLVIHTERGGVRSIESSIALVYGDRHYLDDRPIHCGTFLELQHIAELSDDFGEFTVYRNAGTFVRYEVEHRLRRGTNITERVPVMYVGAAGRSFKATIDAGCYFRWPERDS